jgi:uncharacterized RDD family membrane protein YckC
MDLLNEFIPQQTQASLSKRWFGALIDYIIYTGIMYFVIVTFGDVETDIDGSTSYVLRDWWGLLVVSGIWGILRPGIETFNDGQSIGKAIIGIKVVRMDGSKPGFDNIFARNFFDWVDFLPLFGLLGILVASANKTGQRVGDLVGKTIVVNARKQ